MIEPLTWEVVGGPDDREVRLRLRGEIDLATREALLGAVAQASEVATDVLVLDLREVGFLDSSGLAALLHAAKQTREAGRELVIEAPEGGEANLLIQLTGTGSALGLRRPPTR